MASHTSTGEWKSFEIRMRRRRAEHLVVRAEAAAEAGCFDDAREALQEARRLAPDLPQLTAAEHSIQELQNAARVKRQPRPREASLYAAIAVVLMAGTAAGIWTARHTPIAHVSAASDEAPPVVETQPPAPPRPPRPVIIDRQPVTVTETPLTPTRPAPTDMEAERLLQPTLDQPISERPILEPPPAPTAVPAVVPHPDAQETASVPTVTRIPAGDIAVPPNSASPAPIPAVPVAARPSAANAAVENSAPDDDALVQRALDRYATAYSRLDADAAQQVWPSVNRDALARAFDNLALQQVSLGNCRIDVHGEAAHAACAGTATWAPKVGAREPHTQARNWMFELARAGSAWQIVTARVQNK